MIRLLSKYYIDYNKSTFLLKMHEFTSISEELLLLIGATVLNGMSVHFYNLVFQAEFLEKCHGVLRKPVDFLGVFYTA